jgi:hypothetical protein
VRLTRRSYAARIKVTDGPAPILVGFGLITFQATTREALELARELIDAVEQAQRGGGAC